MDSSDTDSSSDSEIEEFARIASDKMKSILSYTDSQHNLGYSTESDSESDDESDGDVSQTNATTRTHVGFIIDKKASENAGDKNVNQIDSVAENNSVNTMHKEVIVMKRNKKHKNVGLDLSSSIESGLNFHNSYLSTKSSSPKEQDKNRSIVDKLLTGSKADAEIMKKSVMTADIEKKDSLPPYEESLRQLKKQRKKEREKTKGKGWYGMKAPEMTDETKNDLEVLKMRKALDPKRFYKNNDFKALPKFFQFGTVVETSADFYHSRIPKKQRKSNMVQELLADAEFRKYNKRKYIEVQEAKMKGIGPYDRMKKFKKKKKIH